ncbi:unnamed protein product [Discosporangium mesarthrocarpum]
MLDHVCVFSKSGLVLWSRTMAKLKGSPVDDLVKSVLLEEKGGVNVVTTDWYTLRWSLANELGIVVVALYQKSLQLQYVEDLVETMKKDFVRRYGASLQGPDAAPVQYDKHFDKLLKEAEGGAAARKPEAQLDGKEVTVSAVSETLTDSRCWHETKPGTGAGGGGGGEGEGRLNKSDMALARARLKARTGGRKGGRGAGSGHGMYRLDSSLSSGAIEGQTSKKKGKQATVWHDSVLSGGKLSEKQKASLDHSKKTEGAVDDDDSVLMSEMRNTYLPEEGEGAEWEDSDSDLDDDILGLENMGTGDGGIPSGRSGSWGSAFKRSTLGSLLHGLTGNKVLEAEDLVPVMEKMRTQLMSRNVAKEVAEDITSSVQATLTNQKLKSFTRVSTTVQEALKGSISRVLTPKRSTDILREVKAAKSKGCVYSVVFVGINGVGKSTSLAKVAYYLKQNGIKVLIAACDTFRSGAVEQLSVHSRCLEVAIFEKAGYVKDASSVAKLALKHAEEEGYDCVLIDTAGRMQNNEPLMRALSKLISDNEPDLSLFVGEALVGNDGVNQLQMFNEALANYSPTGRQHQIDGVVLTKFDTIDTKVGAALSMCYKTGQPIMFVGTGQKYTHLRKLNVHFVIKALFS